MEYDTKLAPGFLVFLPWADFLVSRVCPILVWTMPHYTIAVSRKDVFVPTLSTHRIAARVTVINAKDVLVRMDGIYGSADLGVRVG